MHIILSYTYIYTYLFIYSYIYLFTSSKYISICCNFSRTPLWFLIWCLSWAVRREPRSTSHRSSPTVVRYLLVLVQTQICPFITLVAQSLVIVWDIWCLQTPEHQMVLFKHGAIQNIAPLLISPSYKVYRLFLILSFYLIHFFLVSICIYTIGWYSSSTKTLFIAIASSGPDAGIKVFLSPGLWKHSGLINSGKWWGNLVSPLLCSTLLLLEC